MTKEDFGRLVTALRKENIDMAVGKVWTQKTLAQRSNLAERTIGQIEQGTKMGLDPQLLAQLANALNLTSLERKAFHAAAAEVDIDLTFSIKKTPAEVLDELLLETRNVRTPAFIYDSYYNVIAANSIMRALSFATDELLETGHDTPAGFNLLRYYFAPESPYRDLLGPGWSKFAIRTVQHFRASSLRYRHTERFVAIFKDLCRYPLFQDFWVRTKYADEDIYYSWEGVNYHHPELGPVNFIVTEVATLTGEETLFFITYVPRDRETSKAFEDLGQRKGTNMHRLMPWPYR